MELPKVSIVIANYNKQDYVAKAIQSALDQDYPGYIDICIVDDGSSDESWDKILDFFEDPYSEEESHQSLSHVPSLQKILTKKNIGNFGKTKLIAIKRGNGGASEARNTAIAFCWKDTDIFGILDSDDEYFPEKVSKLVSKLSSDSRIGVAYADYVIKNEITNTSRQEFKYPYSKRELERHCIVHSGSLIKKEALEAVVEEGRIFDPSLHGPASQEFIGCSEDYDLWLRISRVFMIVHVPETLSLYRETGDNQSFKMTPEIFSQNQQRIVNKIVNVSPIQ